MSKKEYKGGSNAIFKGRQDARGMHFTDRNPCVGKIVRTNNKNTFHNTFFHPKYFFALLVLLSGLCVYFQLPHFHSLVVIQTS